ncbi:MAG: response regulator [Bacteroidetes bacterium]|nr:response regulator [Bacteroidota bacterium]
MLKAVIIDDEEDAVQFISSILAEYCPDIEIAGTGNSALQGIKAINHHHPDLVFLDIEMPDGTGFDLLESLSNRDFEVIFVTAYNQYAIHAFKFSAVDYIMKPVNIRELLAAVERVREKRRTPGGMKPDYKAVIENVRADSPEKLALPTAHEIEYVNI